MDCGRRNDTETARAFWNCNGKIAERLARQIATTLSCSFSQSLSQLPLIRAVSPFKIRGIRDKLLTLPLPFLRSSASSAVPGYTSSPLVLSESGDEPAERMNVTQVDQLGR